MRSFLVLMLLFLACCEPPCPKGEVLIKYNCGSNVIFIPNGEGIPSQVWYEDCDEQCVLPERLR